MNQLLSQTDITIVEASTWPPMMDPKYLGKLPLAKDSAQDILIIGDGRWLEGCIHCFMGKHWEPFRVYFKRNMFCLKQSDGSIHYWLDWEQIGYQEGAQVPQVQQ